MTVRAAAVAGYFYPDEPNQLTKTVNQMLDAGNAPALPAVRVLIVPHAGYQYSGKIAAQAYQLLQPHQFKRVLLLGPNHRVPLRGVALPSVDTFTTPIGDLPLDTDAIEMLSQQDDVEYFDLAHQGEHCLEVQLPFLLRTLGNIKIIPLIVGEISAQRICQLLAPLMTSETLLVISSDLSHFHSQSEAKIIDQQTLNQILTLQPTLTGQQACGAYPLNGALLWAAQQGLTPQLLAVSDSVAGGGDTDSVVGYAALALH